MLRFAVLLCVMAVVVKGQSTVVSQCIRNSGELPLHTYIEGCEQPPCQLPQLQDAVVNLVFRVPRLIRRMQTKATSVWFLTVTLEHDLEEHADTCNYLENTSCPVSEGELVKYQLRMFIPSTWPVGTMVPIELRVEDDNGVSFTCIRVPIRIVPAVSGTNLALKGTVTDV